MGGGCRDLEMDREMDVQIDVVELELLERCAYGGWDVVDVVHDLCRHEKLAAVYAALLNCAAEFRLGLVD